MSVLAIVKSSGAAVTYEQGALSITGLGNVSYEHVIVLDSSGGLDWVKPETREWFHSAEVSRHFAKGPQRVSPATASSGTNRVRLDIQASPIPYYRDEFLQMFDSNEVYLGKFNWAAFWFGWFWALIRGLWHIVGVIAVLVFIASLIGTPILGTVIGIGTGIWLGMRGNHILYCKQVKEEYVFS